MPSAFASSVQFDTNGELTGAGGLFPQIMPGIEDGKITALEEILQRLPSVGHCIAEQLPAEQLPAEQIADLSPLLPGRRLAAFMCGCSKSRFHRFMAALPEDELADILENGPFPFEQPFELLIKFFS